MTDEQLLIGDDAIHGEEAYCFNDDVDGLEPTITARERAADRLDRIHRGHDFDSEPPILEGRDIEAQTSSEDGNGRAGRSDENKKKE